MSYAHYQNRPMLPSKAPFTPANQQQAQQQTPNQQYPSQPQPIRAQYNLPPTAVAAQQQQQAPGTPPITNVLQQQNINSQQQPTPTSNNQQPPNRNQQTQQQTPQQNYHNNNQSTNIPNQGGTSGGPTNSAIVSVANVSNNPALQTGSPYTQQPSNQYNNSNNNNNATDNSANVSAPTAVSSRYNYIQQHPQAQHHHHQGSLIPTTGGNVATVASLVGHPHQQQHQQAYYFATNNQYLISQQQHLQQSQQQHGVTPHINQQYYDMNAANFYPQYPILYNPYLVNQMQQHQHQHQQHPHQPHQQHPAHHQQQQQGLPVQVNVAQQQQQQQQQQRILLQTQPQVPETNHTIINQSSTAPVVSTQANAYQNVPTNPALITSSVPPQVVSAAPASVAAATATAGAAPASNNIYIAPYAHNQAAPFVNQYAPPQQNYTKREKKPLLIKDPITKMPVNQPALTTTSISSNELAGKEKDATNANATMPKSQTQPLMSASSSNSSTPASNTTTTPSINTTANTATTTTATTTTTNSNNTSTNENKNSNPNAPTTAATTTSSGTDKNKSIDLQAQVLKKMNQPSNASVSSKTATKAIDNAAVPASSNVSSGSNDQQKTVNNATTPSDTANKTETTNTENKPITSASTSLPATTTAPSTNAPPATFSYSQVAQSVPKNAIPMNQLKTNNAQQALNNSNNKSLANANNNESSKSASSTNPSKQPISTTSDKTSTAAPSTKQTTISEPNKKQNATESTVKQQEAEAKVSSATTQQAVINETPKPAITKQTSESSSDSTTKSKPMTVSSSILPTESSTTTTTTPSTTTQLDTTNNKLNDNNNNIDPKLPLIKKTIDDSKSSTSQANIPTIESTTTTSTTASSSATWTPENKDGKKRYTREFLLSFRDKKLSNVLPDAIKNNTDLLQQDPNSQKQGEQYSYDYVGGRSKSNAFSGGGGSQQYGDQNMYSKGSMQKNKNRGSITGSKVSSDNRQQVPAVFQLERDMPIKNRAENPYVIDRFKKGQRDETEELLREVRNIMNKLTPNTLQKLTGDLIALPINNEERLKSSIDVIFEKALDEPNFSETYANLCKVLAQIKVPSSKESSKQVTFRTVILSRCQKEFDTDFYQEINYDKLIQDVDACTDEVKKRELKELAEEKLSKAKRRSLGNIRFIGELFKLGMLTESIMNDCIDRLLKQETDEENLECLCKLLSTIGKDVDKPNNANKMKNYFERLEKITKKKDTSQGSITSRIRFMILDVIDLRKNAWVPRRKDNNPRLLEEIRKEAEEERLRQEAEIARNQQNERRQQSGPKGQVQGKYQQSLKSTSMDESYKVNKTQNGNMVNKIKDVKSITTKTSNAELTLGPSGGSGFMWNKKPTPAQNTTSADTQSGITNSTSYPISLNSSNRLASSSSGTTNISLTNKSQTIDESESNKKSSSYAAAATTSSQGYKSTQQSKPINRLSMDSQSNKPSGGAITNKQFSAVKKLDTITQQSGSQQSLATNSDVSSQASSRDTSLSRQSRDNSRTRDPSNVDPSSKENRQSYTSDEIERKAVNTIEEYIQNKDVSEALKDFDDFRPVEETQYSEFMEHLINKVLERNDNTRTAMGQLFYSALKHKKVEIKYFVASLKNVLETAEDMAIDVPKIATYLSQIIAPLFQKDLSVEFLSEACEPIKSKRICAELIAEILHSASNRLGHNAVTDIFKSSNLRINEFLNGVPKHSDFIKENKIEWIMGTRERTQSASISTESFENKLYEILENSKEKNETIFENIENEFGECDFVSKAFIRALVISVCRSCFIDSKIDTSLFKERSSILTRFLSRNEELELEALFAVQAFDHRMKHQPGWIRILCDLLYDEDIIREDVFWKWKSDVREEGHAISALSLKGFFEWLNEAEAPQDENSN